MSTDRKRPNVFHDASHPMSPDPPMLASCAISPRNTEISSPIPTRTYSQSQRPDSHHRQGSALSPSTNFEPHCGLPIFAIGETTNTAPGPPKTPRPLSRQHPIARRIAASYRRPEHLLTPSDAARTSHPSGDSTSVRSEIRERDSGGWVACRERWVSLKAVDTSWTVTPWRSGINVGRKSVCCSIIQRGIISLSTKVKNHKSYDVYAPKSQDRASPPPLNAPMPSLNHV